MDPDLNLDGHVALVTGSATGLGHSCAEAFSRQGATVALASPNLGDLAYASDRLHALGEGDVFAIEADVRQPEQVAAFVEETVDQHGGIDHVVTGPRPPESDGGFAATDEDWFRGFDRLFMSAVWTAREARPWLADSPHGTLVNVTAPTLRLLDGESPVAAAFGRAVRGLTEAQAASFAPEVRANAVLPGPHDTDDLTLFLSELVDRGVYDDVETARRAALADTPFDEPGDPLALGNLVAFLSSEHAGFLNGAAIPVDGGAGGRPGG